MTHTESMKQLLERLESELNENQLWQTEAPLSHKLESQQPFAVDTLEPHEWLQWIFIAKIRQLISNKQPLPKGYAIAGYFEQTWNEQAHLKPLLELLNEIDEVNQSC
ncbi:YqcC family protein [Vibrio marisflavi]|uniref:YqcC-like domain-containing protein n=1 Tax=Vibrio marisflavi CECT 7928 TaxID=634439 RepID=A0ABN8E1M6_9VIBR|nr:YqcC family protein [Vibrio marisflavi]CAH0538901.1 hypothetical protein VMF7928_01747 [Vibrio marisflavi CECT 7928]